MNRALNHIDDVIDHAMEYALGEDEDSEDNSAFNDDGDFVALESFDSKAIARKKKAAKKRALKNKSGPVDNTEDATIEKTSSVDSELFKDSSCAGRIGDYFGWNPDTIVVKILAAAKTKEAKKRSGLCEPMPLPGVPPLIIVGRVMTKTHKNCPLNFDDRVLGLLPAEMYYSEAYANLPFDSLIKIKNNLQPWQQVSIALSYLPALQALQSVPFTVEGNKVLLNGGLGPVNQALIHLVQLHNAKKVYVPCEPQYSSLVRELGAKPCGPRHNDWGPLFYESLDVVIDSIGQNHFITSKAMLVETGHLVVLGSKDLDSKKGELTYAFQKKAVDWRLMSSSRTTVFDFMKVFNSDREAFKKDFNYLDKMMWKEELPDINMRVNVDEINDGGRESDILDGYEIIDIPQEKEWA